MYKDIDGTKLSIGFKAPQFVYGELASMHEYFRIFSFSSNLKEKCIFCDLGSGLGKANLVVAAMFPVAQSIGIERIPKMNDLALDQQCLFEKIIAPRVKNNPRISFLCSNVLKSCENWLCSDVVFVNSLTWTTSVLKKIKKQLENLKPGCEIFTSSEFSSKLLLLTQTIRTEMNWGVISMYLYLRVDPF